MFRNLGIGQRIGIGFGLIVVLLLAVVATSVHRDSPPTATCWTETSRSPSTRSAREPTSLECVASRRTCT